MRKWKWWLLGAVATAIGVTVYRKVGTNGKVEADSIEVEDDNYENVYQEAEMPAPVGK